MSHRAEINGSRKNAFLFFNLDFNFDLCGTFWELAYRDCWELFALIQMRQLLGLCK